MIDSEGLREFVDSLIVMEVLNGKDLSIKWMPYSCHIYKNGKLSFGITQDNQDNRLFYNFTFFNVGLNQEMRRRKYDINNYNLTELDLEEAKILLLEVMEEI